MFTYKFGGLRPEDATTPYYYGSLPAKPEVGQILRLDETGNRYRVTRIVGKGLEGDNGAADQKKLAYADIVHGKSVPILWLSFIEEPRPKRKIKLISKIKVIDEKRSGKELPASKKAVKEMSVDGRSFDADEFKERSRTNRKIKFKKPIR